MEAVAAPVPIPNTEVKTASADGTWRETAWESRASPEFISLKGTRRDPGPLCVSAGIASRTEVFCMH